MLLADNRRSTTVVCAGSGGYTQDPAENFFLERYADAYRLELDAFVHCLDTGAAPEPGGADGLRALELADAAVQSARTGNAIAVSI